MRVFPFRPNVCNFDKSATYRRINFIWLDFFNVFVFTGKCQHFLFCRKLTSQTESAILHSAWRSNEYILSWIYAVNFVKLSIVSFSVLVLRIVFRLSFLKIYSVVIDNKIIFLRKDCSKESNFFSHFLNQCCVPPTS